MTKTALGFIRGRRSESIPQYIGLAETGWDDQWCAAGDRFFLNGVLIDLTYNTLEWVDTVVCRVTGEGLASLPELRFRAYTMLGLLEGSLILYDPDAAIAGLRDRLRPYPEKLKQAPNTHKPFSYKMSVYFPSILSGSHSQKETR